MNTIVPYMEPPKPELTLRSRCGYPPNEVIQSLVKTLGEAGPVATGRVLHFTADLVCSGGLNSLIRVLWDYALLHIGIASPRVFVYLRQRTREILTMMKSLPDETAYSTEEFQIRVGELILVLRDAPTRSIVPWPKVGPETHDESWIRAIKVDGISESAALRIVWKPEGDMGILRTAGSYLCKAINDGSIDKAFFWIKWLLEEDAIVRKVQKGPGLSTIERGPAGLSVRQRTDVSFFILELYGEIYKDLAGKQLVRMHEEFNALIELWKNPPKGLGAGSKKQILTILTQILAEVPKWKVPAAVPLIKDPTYVARAVRMVPKFFHEVLSYDAPRGSGLEKAFKSKGSIAKKVKEKPKTSAQTQMEAFDKAMEAYMGLN